MRPSCLLSPGPEQRPQLGSFSLNSPSPEGWLSPAVLQTQVQGVGGGGEPSAQLHLQIPLPGQRPCCSMYQVPPGPRPRPQPVNDMEVFPAACLWRRRGEKAKKRCPDLPASLSPQTISMLLPSPSTAWSSSSVGLMPEPLPSTTLKKGTSRRAQT